MKKYWIITLMVCFISTSSFVEANDYIKEYELTNHPTLSFDESSNGYVITLKGTKCTHYTLIDTKNVDISYIVSINVPVVESGVIHLSLQDKDGFEITRKSLSRVAPGFNGKLKGNFTIKAQEYQRISGAELFFTVPSK